MSVERNSLTRRSNVPVSAFTLVEMLAVMAIMVIMLVLVVPVAGKLLRGSNLMQSGELVSDQLALARQSAIASNRTVQVRFYQLPIPSATGATNFCAMQTFRIEQSSQPASSSSSGSPAPIVQVTPLTKLQALHTNVMFADDATHSTLLVPPSTAVLSVNGTTKLPAYGNQSCPYVGFQYLPDGSTDLDPTVNSSNGGWFITLVNTDTAVPSVGRPTNFYALRVDPINGRVVAFRP